MTTGQIGVDKVGSSSLCKCKTWWSILKSEEMSTLSRRTWLQAMAVSAPSWSTRYLPLSMVQLWPELANSELQSVGRYPVADIQDTVLMFGRQMTRFHCNRRRGTAVCHQHKHEKTCQSWQPGPQDPPCTEWITADQGLHLAEPSTWRRLDWLTMNNITSLYMMWNVMPHRCERTHWSALPHRPNWRSSRCNSRSWSTVSRQLIDQGGREQTSAPYKHSKQWYQPFLRVEEPLSVSLPSGDHLIQGFL